MVVVGAQQPQHQHQHTRQKDAARPLLYEILETRRRQGQLPSPRLSYPLQVTQGEGGNIASSCSFAKIPPVRYSK